MRTLCILLLTAVPAWSQLVVLPTQVKGDVGSWIHIKPIKVDGGIPKWRIDNELDEVLPETFLPPEVAKLFIGKLVRGPVGKFKVESWNAKGDVAGDIVVCWVVIGGASPTPAPPIPAPPRANSAKHLSFVGKPIDIVKVANDIELRAYLKLHNVSVHIIQDNDPIVLTGSFKQLIQDTGMPSVVIQGIDGKVLASGLLDTVKSTRELLLPFLEDK